MSLFQFAFRFPGFGKEKGPAEELAGKKSRTVSGESALPIVERSMNAITPHIPAAFLTPFRQLFAGTPILVRVVKRRKTKHGDHRLTKPHGFSVITVNASGNPWQFTLTLLHEIAHAHVAHRISQRVPPHGPAWKSAFRHLLQDHLMHFPATMQGALADYARNPLYSSGAHAGLAAALRQYDTLDLRPIVSELPLGQKFTLDGKLILIKGERMRSWFRCKSIDGRIFRVAPTARVHTVYPALSVG